jgi:WS/DGAT/MGAT family acyltransferase
VAERDEGEFQGEALSGADAAWFRMDSSTNLMVVNAILFFDEPLDLDTLYDIVEQRLLSIPRFKQRVVTQKRKLNRPHWETDPHFSIEAHVHHVGLPGEGDEALQRFLGDLVSQPLDATKPLWQLYLLEGLPRGNALVARIHHSLADGFALLYLMTRVVDPGDPIEFPMGSVTTVDPDENAEEVAEVARSWRERRVIPGLPDVDTLIAMGDPRKMRSAAKQAGIASAVTSRLLMMSPAYKSSLRGDLGTIKRVGWTRGIPLQQVKQVGAKFGGTVNDVLLLALTDSLRTLLIERGEEPGSGADLRCVMPVNLKPLHERGADLGNGFGLVFLELPIGEESPDARLAKLKERLDGLKRSPEAFMTYAVLTTMGVSLQSAQSQLVKLFHNKSSAIATNVPGPVKPVRFAGRDISRILFWVPQSADVGLGFSIFSYCGVVQVGVQADANIMPDPNLWVDAFHAAFERLLEG